MLNTNFIDRKQELKSLSSVLNKKTASLIIVKGRRRIGKSRLINEFASKHKFIKFSGLAPQTGVDATAERNRFAQSLTQQLDIPFISTDDWGTLFSQLAAKTTQGRIIILFDEISWMAHDDPLFLSKLQYAWENEFQRNPKLILILCGSVSSWINKNILNSTGFFGRVSLTLTLDEMPLLSCNEYMLSLGYKQSAFEKLNILNITGGVPWYIEQINPTVSFLENIKRLCFMKDGLLVTEFNRIFHDLFEVRRHKILAQILQALVSGPKDAQEIATTIEYGAGGVLAEYLTDLETSGYIHRDYTWALQSAVTSKLSRYRLKDNYIRFYLKYIEPKRRQIERQQFQLINISALPGFQATMGLQFENLILNNRALIFEILGIPSETVIQDNTFFQKKTNRIPGCQIDYLIQTTFHTLYICEIKFSAQAITPIIISEVKEKIKRIKIPKGFTCIPVLIVANGVTDEVIDNGYFFKIINLAELI